MNTSLGPWEGLVYTIGIVLVLVFIWRIIRLGEKKPETEAQEAQAEHWMDIDWKGEEHTSEYD